MTPSVVATPPRGFVSDSANVKPPSVAAGAGAEVTQWAVWRAPDRSEAFVLACVATPIPGWVEDMRAPVAARTVALAGASTERAIGSPIDARWISEGAFVLRLAGETAPRRVGTARTFMGFDESRVATCIATCATPRPASSTPDAGAPFGPELPLDRPLACEDAVASATLVASAPAPQPGLVLRAVTWSVHHPRAASMGLAMAFAAACVLAVATRKRPRLRS